ncbi:exopolysaccharide biosynthesis protein [Minwuia thermotolerans]|uniref:Exopolysaccharide biosynthesis protein n=1 Tax=Minwuia thermotolerans TaxID=2056226 RepID=A0A2M9G718_9PROT|nr:exopolysaccharide biosynthesis protein [Minwuia thermotolerans]PJK31519.1 exopolysaccharide biosynthesis protein [Minwuia thermotolerans]
MTMEAASPGRARGRAAGGGEPESLTEVLDRLLDHADGRQVSVGEMLDAFDKRAFAPLLLVPGLVALGPTGAIPGVSIATATIIVLVALQMLVGADHPWLPDRAQRVRFPKSKLQTLVQKSRPVARFIDRFLKHRLTTLTDGIFGRLGAIFCIAMAATMYPLALVPFGVALPSAAIVVFSLGLAARDGVMVILANALGLGALGLAGWFVMNGASQVASG